MVPQVPVAGLQTPARQALGEGQAIGAPGAHWPFWQVSITVQLLPSLHVLPFILAG
jgi:hypothetical protein